MPFIEVKTNKNLTSVDIENIEKEVEKHIVLLKKSKEWLMVNVIPFSPLRFSASNEDCLIVEVKTYSKVNYDDANKFSKAITDFISLNYNIKKSRIYVAYFDTLTWSFEGENF